MVPLAKLIRTSLPSVPPLGGGSYSEKKLARPAFGVADRAGGIVCLRVWVHG